MNRILLTTILLCSACDQEDALEQYSSTDDEAMDDEIVLVKPAASQYDPEGPDEPVAKYWQASNTDHRASVRISTSAGSCSGALLNDQTILTAGHCVSGLVVSGNSGSTTVTIAIDEPGVAPRSLGSFAADFWFVDDNISGGDIAIIRTDNWIAQGIDTDNFIMIPQSSQAPQSNSWSFGYGMASPTGSSSNDQRMAVNSVATTSTNWYTVNGGTGLACRGDSGGPATVGTLSTWDLVYGVHSGSSPTDPTGNCAADGNASQYKANVRAFSNWIANTLSSDGDNDFQCANWTTPANQAVRWCWQLK